MFSGGGAVILETIKETKKFTRKEKIDYKAILDEATFQRFNEMRQIRKAMLKPMCVIWMI